MMNFLPLDPRGKPDFRKICGKLLDIAFCKAGNQFVGQIADSAGVVVQVHGKPPVVVDEIGVCHSATARASRQTYGDQP